MQNIQKKNIINKNLVLILLVVVITFVPMIFLKNAEFGGADGIAEEAIGKLDPDYKAWAKPIWSPPSGEIESLLFSLQAAIGSGIVFYYIGYMRGKKKGEEANE